MAAPDKKQAQMKEQIKTFLRKKDYYDILGISKTSDDAQIKKAYKKLALRFHPDKNGTEGSKQVFKKVSNAYTNLIDPDKRAQYDRYGPQEDRQPRYRPQRQYRQGYTQQDQFEDIFRAFFGGGMGGMQRGHFQNNHFQHFTFNMGGPRAQNQGNGGSNFLYFMIFILVLYVLPAFFSKDQPLYSTSASSTYKFPLKTTVFQVQYYVRQEYFTQNKNGQYTKTIQSNIDTQYVLKLKKQCDMLQWSRGYGTSTATQQKYRASCRRLQQLQQKYPEYIRDLFYSY